MEHEGESDTSYGRCIWNNPQRIDKGIEGLGNKSRAHLDDINIKIGQNTEKSPGDLRRLVVTHTPVRNHQQTQVLGSTGNGHHQRSGKKK